MIENTQYNDKYAYTEVSRDDVYIDHPHHHTDKRKSKKSDKEGHRLEKNQLYSNMKSLIPNFTTLKKRKGKSKLAISMVEPSPLHR